MEQIEWERTPDSKKGSGFDLKLYPLLKEMQNKCKNLVHYSCRLVLETNKGRINKIRFCR
jgi:hypothetical protein